MFKQFFFKRSIQRTMPHYAEAKISIVGWPQENEFALKTSAMNLLGAKLLNITARTF